MKKILFLLMLVSLPVQAEKLGNIGPGNSLSAAVTIEAPGADKQNCLTHLSGSVTTLGSSLATFQVLSAGTTIWQVALSTVTGFQNFNPITVPIAGNDPICADSNTQMKITTTGTTYSINYKGIIRRTE